MFKTDHLPAGGLYFIGIFHLLLLTSIWITFRLVEKLSKHEKCSMQVELLANTTQNLSIDNNVSSLII
jgi:hypothetical protein